MTGDAAMDVTVRRIAAGEAGGSGGSGGPGFSGWPGWAGFAEEAAELLGLLVEGGAALGWVTPPSVDEVSALLREVVAVGEGEACLVGAWLGPSLVGLGWWRRYQRPTWRHNADLEKVAVAPEAQGRGVGRRLVAELRDSAAEAGVEVLTLDLRGDNARAGRLYESLGFVEYGRLRGFVAVGERRYDSVFYACSLSSVSEESAGGRPGGWPPQGS